MELEVQAAMNGIGAIMDEAEFASLSRGDVLEDQDGVVSIVEENDGDRVFVRVMHGLEKTDERGRFEVTRAMTIDEIAEIFGMSVSRVRRIMSSAERRFRSIYKKDQRDGGFSDKNSY